MCASGPAESGKSTLIKQVKIIHSQGFSNKELISFKVLDSCKANSPFHINSMAGQSDDSVLTVPSTACCTRQPVDLDEVCSPRNGNASD